MHLNRIAAPGVVLLLLFSFLSCYEDNKSGPPRMVKTERTGEALPAVPSLSVLEKKYRGLRPRFFSPWVRGTKKRIQTTEKILVLTMDACGGFYGSGYDARLIAFLRKERIPASLFITGRWGRLNRKILEELGRDPLFTLENHGDHHRPASVAGLSKYGIPGTRSIAELYSEVVVPAKMLRSITGRFPRYYRPGTAYIDDVAVKIVHDMGFEVLSFTVAPGDAEVKLPLKIMMKRFMSNVHPGAIVLIHMNKPRGKIVKLMEKALPKLRKRGYRFVPLADYRDKLV